MTEDEKDEMDFMDECIAAEYEAEEAWSAASCSRVYSLPDSDLIEAYRLIWNLRGKLAAGDCCWNIARAALAVLIEAEITKNDESH